MYRISDIDIRNLNDVGLTAISAHIERAHREVGSGEMDVDAIRADLLDQRSDVHRALWGSWHDSELVGICYCGAFADPDAGGLVDLLLHVSPDHRRSGAGSRLLDRARSFAREIEADALIARTKGREVDGAAFAEAVGADVAYERCQSALLLNDDVQRNVDNRFEHARRGCHDFDLVWFDGPYPEDVVPHVVEALSSLQEAPTGLVALENLVGDFFELRKRESSLAADGVERSSVFAVDRTTSAWVGLSGFTWDPRSPQDAVFDGTGVNVSYRGRGLARLLMLAVIKRVSRERGEVTRVLGETEASNVAVHRLHAELGFQPVETTTIWRLDVRARPEPRSGSPSRSAGYGA